MLEQATSPRDRALFTVFRDTGCRGAEAAAMTWEDIDFEKQKIKLNGKGNKPRTVPFKPMTAEVLQTYQATLKPDQRTGPVWWGKLGPLTYSGLYQIFKRTAEQAMLQCKRFNPHSWRHAFGRDTTRNGMPTVILQKLMGHESIETILRYVEVEDSTLKEAYDKFAP